MSQTHFLLFLLLNLFLIISASNSPTVDSDFDHQIHNDSVLFSEVQNTNFTSSTQFLAIDNSSSTSATNNQKCIDSVSSKNSRLIPAHFIQKVLTLTKEATSNLNPKLKQATADAGQTDQVWNDVSPQRSAGGTFRNCTFNACTSPISGGALYLDESNLNLIVSNCSFFSCRSTDGSGGSIYCYKSEIFIVQNGSKFDYSSANGSGGAVRADGISTCFFVHNSGFTRCCSTTNSGGGLYLESSPSQPLSSMCTADDVKDEFGGVVLCDLTVSECLATEFAGGIDVVFPCESYSIHNCAIAGCLASSGGGVRVFFDNSSISPQSIFAHVFFNSNSASVNGHDILLVSGLLCPFNQTFGPFDPHTSSTGTPAFAGRRRNFASVCLVSDNIFEAADENWLPFGVFVNNESLLTDECGWNQKADAACNSLTAAVWQANAYTGFPILLLSGTHRNENQKVWIGRQLAKQIEIAPFDGLVTIEIEQMNVESWIEVANLYTLLFHNITVAVKQKQGTTGFTSCLFSVTGALALEFVNFACDQNVICSSSLLALRGGAVSFSSVTFSSIHMGSSSLLSIRGSSSLAVERCQFVSIAKEGNGGIINNEITKADDSLSQSITISNSTFDGCSANGGDGGAIYILLQKGTKVKIGSDSESEKTLFKNCEVNEQSSKGGKGGAICLSVEDGFSITQTSGNPNPLLCNLQFGNEDGTSEPNKASFGPDIFVYGASEELVSATNFPVLDQWINQPITVPPSFLEGWDTQTMGFFGTDVDSPLPLLFYRFLLTETVRVNSGNGRDVPLCGLADLPCLTLRHPFERVRSKEKNIIIEDSANYVGPDSLGSYPVTVTCKETSPTLSIQETADYSLSSSARFTSLIFSLPSSLSSSSSLFSSSSPSLCISSSSLRLNDELPYSLFSFSDSASLLLSFVTLQPKAGSSSSSSSSSLFSLDGTASLFITGDNTTFSSITFTKSDCSLIRTTEKYSGTISLTSATFSSLRDSSSSSSSLSSSSFTSASSSSSQASSSVLFSPSFSTLSLSLTNTTFTSCVSTKSVQGGAIFFFLSPSASFSATNTTAGECKCDTSEGKGGWLYIEGSNPFISTPSTLLPLSLTLTGMKFKGNEASEGMDIFINIDSLKQIRKDTITVEWTTEEEENQGGGREEVEPNGKIKICSQKEEQCETIPPQPDPGPSPVDTEEGEYCTLDEEECWDCDETLHCTHLPQGTDEKEWVVQCMSDGKCYVKDEEGEGQEHEVTKKEVIPLERVFCTAEGKCWGCFDDLACSLYPKRTEGTISGTLSCSDDGNCTITPKTEQGKQSVLEEVIGEGEEVLCLNEGPCLVCSKEEGTYQLLPRHPSPPSYSSELIFISFAPSSSSPSASDSSRCGWEERPCLSLASGLAHLASPSSSSSSFSSSSSSSFSSSSSSSLSSVFVLGGAVIDSTAITLEDVLLKPPPLSSSEALLLVKDREEREEEKEFSSPPSLITSKGTVQIQQIAFHFDSSFSSSFSHFLCSSSGSLSLTRCSFFCTETAGSSFWSSSSSSSATGSLLLATQGTEVVMDRCSFAADSGAEREDGETKSNTSNGKEEEDGEEEEEDNFVCSWSSSLLHFSGCTATLTQISIQGIEEGALLIDSSADVEIIDGVFGANI